MRLTLRQLFIALLFIGLFLMALRPIADPDFWWHLRTGELIVQTHSIPHTDPFSFTNQGKPWVAHEWLSELFIYGMYRLAGFAGLILVFAAIIIGALLFAYLRCPAGSRPYLAGFAVLLGALATAPTWGVRPQMISFLLTSIFLFLLDRFFQKKRLGYALALPPIMLVWVNLHAGYFLGLAIVGVYIIGGLIQILWNELASQKNGDAPAFKSILVLCGILGACILATFANPNGLHIIIYPFQTLGSPSMQQLIQEWFSPDFHLLEWQPLVLVILLLMGMGMLGKKTISITNILLTLALGFAALKSMRNVPLFILAAVPVLAEQAAALVKVPQSRQPVGKPLQAAGVLFIALAILVTAARSVLVVQQQSKTEADTFPKAAVDWIVANKPSGNMYNTYGWGGYLIWRLYPQYRVYIDGRADVYGDKFIFDFMSIQQAQSGWQSKLDMAGVNLILIEPDTALANALLVSSDWKIGYEDPSSIIFIRDQ